MMRWRSLSILLLLFYFSFNRQNAFHPLRCEKKRTGRRYQQCVCVVCKTEREREREKERRSELEAYLASLRLCNVSTAVGSDGRKLLLCVSLQLICSIMSAPCLITAHLQPGRRCTKNCGGNTHINLYLDWGG